MHVEDSDEAKVLSYGDVVLRASDVKLLEGKHWLNDQIISFSFEHAAMDEFKHLFSTGRVLLLPPSITFLLATFGPSDAGSILEPLQVQDKDLVLFAVTDSTDTETAGAGNHWALLLYCRQLAIFRLYDSAPGERSRAAATRLFQAVRGTLAPGRPCPLEHVQGMPHQHNGYDCGVYLLAATHHILTAAAAAAAAAAATASGTGSSAPCLDLDLAALDKSLGTSLTPAAVHLFRQRLLGQVQELQSRQQQEDS